MDFGNTMRFNYFKNYISIFTALLFICKADAITAQSIENADSLLEHYYSQLPDDSSKVIDLYKKGFDARDKDISIAFAYAKTCEEAANNTKHPYLIAKANTLLGILCFRTGKLKKALEYHKKSLEIREKINDKSGIASCKINIANVFSDLNKKKEAEEYYLQALQLFNEMGNLKEKANALNNIGILKFEAEQYELAKKYFLQSLTIGEKLNDYELKAFCYNNIGTVLEIEKNFLEAKAYYEDALELRELMDKQIDMVDSYENIASVAFELNDIKQAKTLLVKAKNISEQNNYVEGNLSIYNLFKDIYLKEKKYDSAMYYQSLYYQQKETILADLEEDMVSPNTNEDFIESKQLVDNLREENYTLKYLIGVLIVFLIIAGLLLFKKSKDE